MGYFASELQEETGVDGPLPPAGPPAASAVAAYEGGPCAYVGLVLWSAPTGSAEPDWVFGPSIPTRAWSMRHHDLPSGRYVRRFELQARVSELTMLGVQDPWIVAAMHPWSSDWYADSPLRPSPDTRLDRLIAAEASGDVHAFQRGHHFDLFCTDSAWKTAALEPERVARWAASGRLYPPPLPQDVGRRAKAEVPWRNPYFCIGLCGSCDEVKRLRASLAAGADSAQPADLTVPEVIARALLRHPVADQLRALTRDGTLFAVHHATFMGKGAKASDVHPAAVERTEDALLLAARKAIAGPAATHAAYETKWKGTRVASLMETIYVRLLYAINRRGDRGTLPERTPPVHEAVAVAPQPPSHDEDEDEVELLQAHAEGFIEAYGTEAYEATLAEAWRRRESRQGARR